MSMQADFMDRRSDIIEAAIRGISAYLETTRGEAACGAGAVVQRYARRGKPDVVRVICSDCTVLELSVEEF